jgi:acyl-CoA reductase-like NAD-dependent aldehyde dehydrogenase
MITTETTCTPLSDITGRCRTQQLEWEKLPVHDRLPPVRALRRLIVQESEALCGAVHRDIGKPADEALAGELLPFAEACRFLARNATSLLRPRRVSSGQRPLWLWGQTDKIWRRPRGIVGIIGTWNYPVFLNGVQIVQALTAGNAVVWKPSELGPSSALVLRSLFEQAGYPPDLVSVLPATREAGQELANADIDHVVFTGSSRTGRKLAETLGRRLISSTMELSGCDAMFVLEDANVNLAAQAAWFSATANRGQTCISSRRAFVHESIYQPFLDALKPFAESAAPVHLALESQAEQADRLIQDAVSEGAVAVRPVEASGNGGGAIAPGPDADRLASAACWPTVVADARPEMAICQEASFAPIIAVLPFARVEDAINMDASCSYGLAASIFTASRSRANELASRLRVGMVAINDVIVPTAHPATPFGGRRESGWGVTQGAEGLLEMTIPQVVSVKGGKFRPHYSTATGKPFLSASGFQGMLEWGHAATFGQRFHGLRRLIRAIRKKT